MAAAVLTSLGVMLAEPALAALTTFEEYAAMTAEQRSELRASTLGQIYDDAVRRGKVRRAECIRLTYVDGRDRDVQLAFARLRGLLDAGIDIHDDESRVEYAIANHIVSECRPPENDESD